MRGEIDDFMLQRSRTESGPADSGAAAGPAPVRQQTAEQMIAAVRSIQRRRAKTE